MKNIKRMLIAILVLAIIASLAGCTLFGGNYIGKPAAKEAALKDMGLAAADVKQLKCSFEKEAGTAYYEVEFVYDSMEYDYYIDAVNGSVVNVQSESVFD